MEINYLGNLVSLGFVSPLLEDRYASSPFGGQHTSHMSIWSTNFDTTHIQVNTSLSFSLVFRNCKTKIISGIRMLPKF